MKLSQSKLGYIEVEDKPNPLKIKEYYKDQYYQECTSKSFAKNYSVLELSLIEKRLALNFEAIKEVVDTQTFSSFLDVGCGEGFALKFFSGKGFKVVEGIDLSSDGVARHNNDFLANLDVGDVYEKLSDRKLKNKKYDLIWLSGLIELVLDPIKLLHELKTLLSQKGVVVLTCSNNFSELQLHATKMHMVDHEYWVTPEEHLNYFNKDTLLKFCQNQGWIILDAIANFPIEWFIFNDSSNYVKNREVGKNAHQARLLLESLIFEKPVSDVNNYYRALAKIGMGRNITLTLKPS